MIKPAGSRARARLGSTLSPTQSPVIWAWLRTFLTAARPACAAVSPAVAALSLSQPLQCCSAAGGAGCTLWLWRNKAGPGSSWCHTLQLAVVPASPGSGPAHLLAAVLAFLPPLLPSHSHPNKNYGPLENIFLIWSLESARVQTAEIESQLSKVVRKSPSSYKWNDDFSVPVC